jgi:hypothetical protein
VPNVANITVRLALLFGRFNYMERGILDRTHLRFFTHKTARELLEHAGYAILEERLTVMPIELVVGLSSKSWMMPGAQHDIAVIDAHLACFARISDHNARPRRRESCAQSLNGFPYISRMGEMSAE